MAIILSMKEGTFWYNLISPAANEVCYAEQSGDIYEDAVYRRNMMTEELLNVKIKPLFLADGMTNFGLKDDKFVPMNTGVVKANKAYLPLLLAGDVKAFNIVLDGTDGVSSLVKPDSDAEWYDIMGVKVARPVRSGIYIRNGKKVVVK